MPQPQDDIGTFEVTCAVCGKAIAQGASWCVTADNSGKGHMHCVYPAIDTSDGGVVGAKREQTSVGAGITNRGDSVEFEKDFEDDQRAVALADQEIQKLDHQHDSRHRQRDEPMTTNSSPAPSTSSKVYKTLSAVTLIPAILMCLVGWVVVQNNSEPLAAPKPYKTQYQYSYVLDENAEIDVMLSADPRIDVRNASQRAVHEFQVTERRVRSEFGTRLMLIGGALAIVSIWIACRRRAD